MSETEATNPVADETHVSDATGVADAAHAHDGDLNTETGTGAADTPELDDEGNPIPAETAGDDDLDEIEINGKTYKVPKELKEGNLRQQDYTRKTQEVADLRRTTETERTELERQRTQHAEFVQAHREEIGKVERLAADLKSYEGLDWQQAQNEIQALPYDQQPAAWGKYNQAWHRFQALQGELGQAKSSLVEKEKALSEQQTQRVQAAMQSTFETLSRDVPGFNPERANKIAEYGVKTFGITPEEVKTMADPRVWKVLNSNLSMTEENAALKAENARLKGHRAAQTANESAQQSKPAVPVRGSAPATGLSDDLSADEWAKRRNAQVAKRRAG